MISEDICKRILDILATMEKPLIVFWDGYDIVAEINLSEED